MNLLHEQFVAEARELIHQATDDLIAVERDGASAERIDRIFRAFHTLKGSAGVVELPVMTLTLHAAEDLLAAIHSGRLGVTSTIIDRALACLDQVSEWVNSFEAHGVLPLRAGEDAQILARQLRDMLPGAAPKEPLTSDNAGGRRLSAWIYRLIHSERAAISGILKERSAELVAVSYEPRPGSFFDGDDPLALMRAIPRLLGFHIETRNNWPPLSDLDPYVCNLQLQAISAGTRADVANIFRLVPDQVRIVDIPSDALLLETGKQPEGSDTMELVRAILEEQQRVLRSSSQGDDLKGRVGAAVRVAANALRHLRREDLAQRVEIAKETAVARGGPTMLLLALDAARTALSADADNENGGDGKRVTPSVPPADAEEGGRAAIRSLRVDEARIDTLVNLAGELIVAKGGLEHLTRQIDDEVIGHEMARAIKHEHEAIERLAGEIHAAILQLRMVPIAQTFGSFPRLVRDMAQQLNKKVAFVTRGETTELDKTIVDRLFEPLLHIVRNALDHGIESPEQRRAVGKSDTATLTLVASREGDRFVVEVSDNGRGIDPDVVRSKARERQLFAADELAALSDEQVLDLVFSAGFSTAAEVSDISGRGIGMDVVRTTIEQIGGRASLTSQVGTGTTVRLNLPMNISMNSDHGGRN